ncbi:hypothetical protein EWM62_04550 [Mucilaginibacter terrigena]|uniref:Single-stranded DNA-binding protein n=1 Tax=Mucilaginibacter terrigena TaxID=2492395 RepID=A0A4Q5LP98_9SPHI|nr:single-stranded DNA-binding protein [Mucilaginibacter terrigena]RYU91214.1 hypothetical protein EWM62_04550 [Mucilaginibacter terrigena]
MLSNSGINKVLLLGQITGDDFIYKKDTIENYLHFTLVTTESIKKGVLNVEHSEYHKIKVPEKLLSLDKLQLLPGQIIYLEGRIHTSSFVDENRIKRYNVEVLVSKIEVLKLIAEPV